MPKGGSRTALKTGTRVKWSVKGGPDRTGRTKSYRQINEYGDLAYKVRVDGDSGQVLEIGEDALTTI